MELQVHCLDQKLLGLLLLLLSHNFWSMQFSDKFKHRPQSEPDNVFLNFYLQNA